VGAVAWALLLLTAQHFHEAAASVVPVLDRLAAPMAWQSPWIFGWLGSVLIFVSVASPRSVVARLLSAWPLRLVGIVSYSLYLVHVTVIQKLHQLGLESGTGLFLATFAVSYGISVALYGLVERPFLYPTGLPSAQRRAPEPVISSAPAKEVTDERSRS
jgi:peptidoglycan/LPS O-acetylase OafA/YrhL